MNSVNDSLSKLSGLDGFVAAALVDADSGMVLGTEQRGTLNLEVAAAGNTEIVRSKRKAMSALKLKDEISDILITLGKQYHLLRPTKSRPTVFFYLVLDRAHANLAMARISLADVENGMAF